MKYLWQPSYCSRHCRRFPNSLTVPVLYIFHRKHDFITAVRRVFLEGPRECRRLSGQLQEGLHEATPTVSRGSRGPPPGGGVLPRSCSPQQPSKSGPGVRGLPSLHILCLAPPRLLTKGNSTVTRKQWRVIYFESWPREERPGHCARTGKTRPVWN